MFLGMGWVVAVNRKKSAELGLNPSNIERLRGFQAMSTDIQSSRG